MTSTGQETRSTVARNDSSRHIEIARVVSAMTSGVVSRAQSMQSSICFVEWGSGKHLPKKYSRNSR